MEAVELDYRKIAEAVRKALDALEQVLKPMREAMNSIAESLSATAEKVSAVMRCCIPGISKDMRIVAQKLVRLLSHWLISAGNAIIRTVIDYDPDASSRFAALICVLVKSHSAAYLGHMCAVRKGRLLRCRDRGSSDSASDDDYNSTSFTTSFAAAA